MDALRYGNIRLAALLSTVVLSLGLAGCGGSDGNDGAAGAAGPAGDSCLACWDLNENGIADLPDEDLNGDGVVDVLDCNALANQSDAEVQAAIAASKSESCETCHSGAGEEHQAIYDQYVDESDLTLTFEQADVTSVANGDGTFTITLLFNVTKAGLPLNDPTLSSLDQKRFYTAEYFADTREYFNSCRLSVFAAVDAVNGNYSVTDDDCAYAPELSNAQVYGYLADTPLVQHEGGTGAEIPAGSHVHLYDNVVNTAVAFGTAQVTDPLAYESYANVAGCEKCHGAPYLKHGYRAAAVENIPDFAACKVCHVDDRTGGHEDWQWMVDDPLAWATTALGTAEEVTYAYTANIMNDTHMSHAMEFPYPMSMVNCDTCHEDKLDLVLADEFFTAETCKSCHPVQGVDAWPGDTDDAGSQYYQAGRAPAMEYIWAEEGVEFHDMNLDCQVCHVEGNGAPLFSDLHTGYDPRITDPDGNRYADTYTVSVDDVSVDLAANTMTITFSANDAAIVPEVLVSFYDQDAMNFIVPSHAYDASEACPGGRNPNCRLEWEPGAENPLFPSIEGTAPGPWVLTVDMAAWVPGASADGSTVGQPNQSIPDMIADGVIAKAEVTVTPMLTIDEVEVGLDAVTQTIDLGANSLVDDYFKADNAIVDVEKCNVCHDQLGVTFHSGSGRGGDIVACRNCHNPTFTGSHLEMNSRSTENYVHSIHSFQDFDTDDIFNGGVSDLIPGYDPVYSKRYDQHIKHVFPNFTVRNCEACHVDGTVTYNVPDQSETIPGVLSTAFVLDTWYGTYPDDDPLEGKTFEDPSGRNIGSVPEYVTGPASRACGACHRARLINQDEAGALASWNSHTQTNGTYVENDPDDDDVLFGVIDKIMSMFK